MKRTGSINSALAFWLAAVAVSLLAQWELTSRRQLAPGAILFLVAAVVAVIGAREIDRLAPASDPMACLHAAAWTKADPTSVRRKVTGAASVALGLALTATSVYRVASTDSSAVALPLWLAAMALVMLGIGLWTSFPWRIPSNRHALSEAFGVAALVALALALRISDLAGIPIDVHGDEAAVGIAARKIVDGQVPNVFGLGWASQPQLSFALEAFTLRAFGNDLVGLRMGSVLPGCLSVALLYGVVNRLFSKRVAALSAFFLATGQLAIHYSRIGENYEQALFASLLCFYLLLRALKDGHDLEFLLAGYSAGLVLSVYIAARLTLVLAILYLVHRAIGDARFTRRNWRGLAVLVLGAFVFFAPQLVTYARDPTSAFTRTSEVFVLSRDNLAHEFDDYKVSSVADVLRLQALNTIEAFNLRGETSLQYGQTAPLLDFWSGALFVLGVAVVTTRLGEARYFLLAAWLWLTLLLGSVLTVDAMFSPHIVALHGTVAVLPALFLETGWRGLSACFPVRGWRVGLSLVVAIALLVGWSNYVDYFKIHVETMEPPSFFTLLSRYILSVNGRYRVYLLADRDSSLKYDTVHFLVPRIDGVDVRDYPLGLPLGRVPERKGIVFVERNRQDVRFAALKREYPRGLEVAHPNTNGYVEFYSYQVERADLLAADPGAYVDHASIPALELTELSPR